MAKKKANKNKQKQLNDQEHIFVDEYLVSLNPEKAALAAEYAATTARTKAYQWVSNSKQNPKPYIYQAIQKKMAAQSEKTGIKADRVVEELARIGFANIKAELKVSDKIKALENLGKHLGIYNEDNEQKKTTLADFLRGYRDE